MIDFIIKTLDSNNHEFSVDDATTVEQLKEQISIRMGIERHLQRLIFCGRVLQDEKPLAEYNVHGKVIHLVQRAPPGNNEPPPSPRRTTLSMCAATHPAANPGITDPFQQMRRLLAISEPNASMYTEEQQMMSMSPTAGRLDTIRRKITEIKNTLAALQAHLEGEEASGTTESPDVPVDGIDSEATAAANEDEGESRVDENGEDFNSDIATRAQNARRRYYTRAIRSMRARNSRPRDLGQLIEELDTLQEQFAPHRATYVSLLRDAGNTDVPEYTDEERERNQRTVEHVSDIIHSFSHAYHAISEINFRVGQRNPRLTSESTIVRHPTQAHINVVRRPGRFGSPYPTNIISSPQTDNTPSFEAQQNNTNPQGRNTTQPTVNINIEPDPITYQVEIETRVPIAFALENALMNMTQQHQHTANQPTQMGQNNQSDQNQPLGENQADGQNPINLLGQSNLLGQTNQPSQTNQPEQTNQPGQTNLPGQQTQDNQTNQANQPNAQNQGQGNRRRQLFDFENMIRDLGNASGVEVVMSMEEIPSLPGGIQGVAANLSNLSNIAMGHLANLGVNTANAGNTQTQTVQGVTPSIHQTESGVIVGPIASWTGAPSADLLQNIVSSVIRQGLVPGVESLMQAHMQLTGQGNQNPTNGQGAAYVGQATAQATPQAGDQANNQTGQAQPQTAPAQGTATGQRHPSLHLRRATTTTRTHAVTLSNLTYDRFLQCDSAHARRRMARRRELHQQQVAAHEAQRVARINAQSVLNLQNLYTDLTPEHMTLLTSVINGIPSDEACLTALMLILARSHAHSDIMLMTTSHPGFMPAEFLAVRYLMREFMYAMMARARMYRDNTMQSVAEMIVEYNAPFLERMSQVLRLKPNTDLVELFRSLIRCRLPAIAGCVMSEYGANESLAVRFFTLFTRLVTELCALISDACVAGVDGMRTMYRAYINETTSEFNEPLRSLINVLSEANLTHIINNMPGNVDSIINELGRRENIQRNLQLLDTTMQHRREDQRASRPTNQRSHMTSYGLPTSTVTSSQVGQESEVQEENRAASSQSDHTDSSEDSLMEVSPETTQDDPMASSMDDTNDANDSDAQDPSAPEEESSSSTPPSPTSPSSDSPRDQYSPEIVPSCPHIRVSRSDMETDMANQSTPEPATNGIIDDNNEDEESSSLSLSDSDLRISPPMFILEHWGEEWVPVFTRDRNGQRPSQEPCSDAYLSGMPSRKRRCVRQSRPASSVDGLMGESVADVAERPPASDNETRATMHVAMRAAFREHVRDLARSRATASEDFDADQFASAGRFLNSQILNTPDKSDSSSESKDME